MRSAQRALIAVSTTAACVLGGPALAAKPGPQPPPAGTSFKPGVQLTIPTGDPSYAIYGITQAEPSIKVDASGRMYVAAPAANLIGCEMWRVSSTNLADQTFIKPPDKGLGGGDCDLAVSSTVPRGQKYATVSMSSLYLANLVVANSTDGGATWTDPPNPAGSQIAGNDREWMAAAEPGVVYMSYHVVLTNNIQISKSTDGGRTYALANPVPGPGAGQAIDQAHIAQALYNNELGPIVVDLHSTAVPKPVYTIFTATDDALENTGSGDGSTHTLNHDVFLASSFDGGATWTDTLIWRGPIERTYDHIFPALALDGGGGFWAAFISDEEHVYVVHGTGGAGGVTWSAPKRVDTLATDHLANVYPWLVGGGSGRADLVWYGGTSDDPALTNNDTTNHWWVRFAQLSYSGKTGVSVTSNVTASDHAVRNGDICSKGVLCSPAETGRNLLDFFQVALTPDGRAAIAWADDHATPGAQIYVTVQCSGTSATTGQALTSTC
jgi:hypothetical protein